jgi:ribosomal protein L30/L7E
MPLPKTRLVINKDSSLSREAIRPSFKKDVIFGYKNRSAKILRAMRHKHERKTQAKRDLKMRMPMKHLKPRGSFWRFRRIETLAKNKRTEMKHFAISRRKASIAKNVRHLSARVGKAPILVIVRIHGRKNLPQMVSKKLRAMRLAKVGHCVIMRTTPRLIRSLVMLETYVTFGELSPALARDLILKRGEIAAKRESKSGKAFERIDRTPITSNTLVENVLGAHGFLSVEELISCLGQSPYKSRVYGSKKRSLKAAKDAFRARHGLSEKTEVDDDLVCFDESANDGSTGASQGDASASETKTHPLITRAYLETCDERRVQRFDAVADAVNPFVLSSFRVPIRGLKAPFDHKGYWGYRGEKSIGEFIERYL